MLDDATGTVLAISRSFGTRYCPGRDRLAIGRSIGRSWFVAATGLAIFTPPTIDPADPRHLLAAGAAGVTSDTVCRSFDPRVIESRDGGATWAAVAPAPGLNLGSLAFDPVVPGRVYADGLDRLYRSGDGGRSWTALLGFPPGSAGVTLVARSAPLVVRADDGSLWRLSE